MEPGVPPLFYPTHTFDYVERAMEKAIAKGTLSDQDVSLIREYVHEHQASKDISTARIQKVMYTLIT